VLTISNDEHELWITSLDSGETRSVPLGRAENIFCAAGPELTPYSEMGPGPWWTGPCTWHEGKQLLAIHTDEDGIRLLQTDNGNELLGARIETDVDVEAVWAARNAEQEAREAARSANMARLGAEAAERRRVEAEARAAANAALPKGYEYVTLEATFGPFETDIGNDRGMFTAYIPNAIPREEALRMIAAILGESVPHLLIKTIGAATHSDNDPMCSYRWPTIDLR
jgi:hypothetical protein